MNNLQRNLKKYQMETPKTCIQVRLEVAVFKSNMSTLKYRPWHLRKKVMAILISTGKAMTRNLCVVKLYDERNS